MAADQAVAVATKASDATVSTAGGLWDGLVNGGWWSGDMTIFLWVALVGLILACVSGMGWATGLPARKRGHRPERSMPTASRTLFSIALFGVMVFVLNYGGIPVWNMFKSNVLPIAIGFVPFLLVGYLWAGYQYRNFAEDNKEEVRSIGLDYCKREKLAPESVMKDVDKGIEFHFPDPSHKDRWESYFNQEASACLVLAGATAQAPKTLFLNNKEQLTLWIFFWPTSLVLRFWTDVVGRGFDRILMASRGYFEKLSASHDVKVSYGTPPAAPPAADAPPNVVTIKHERNSA